ncbi:MAG: hypothetical protein V7K85_22125 [Nostoc sp.]
MLRGLPFHAGDAVEVIILETKTPQHQAAPKPQLNRVHLENCSSFRLNRKNPHPPPLSQYWEKGSQK